MLETRQVNANLFFQDADVAGVLTDSKSTLGGMFCIFGDHTCVLLFHGLAKKDGMVTQQHGRDRSENERVICVIVVGYCD